MLNFFVLFFVVVLMYLAVCNHIQIVQPHFGTIKVQCGSIYKTLHDVFADEQISMSLLCKF